MLEKTDARNISTNPLKISACVSVIEKAHLDIGGKHVRHLYDANNMEIYFAFKRIRLNLK